MTDLPRPPLPKDAPQPPVPPPGKPAEVKPTQVKPPDVKPPGDEATPSTLGTALGYLKQIPGKVREGAGDALGTAKAAADSLASTVKSGATDAAERVVNPDRQNHEMQAAVVENMNTRGKEMAQQLKGVASSYADLVYYGIHNDEPGAHDKLKAAATQQLQPSLKNVEDIVRGAAGKAERVIKAEVDIAKSVAHLDQPDARAKIASAYTDIVLDVPQLILMADGAASVTEGVTGALGATAEVETAAGAVAEAAGEGKVVPLQPGEVPADAAPPPRLGGYTAEGVGDEFAHGPVPAPRHDLQVETGPGSGRTEAQVIEHYADAMRDPKAGPATAAAREESTGGAHIRENLYYDAAQRRVTGGLERAGVIRATADSVEVLDPDRYLAWLDRAYFHHGETLLDPRMARAVREYVGTGAPIRTIGVNPSSGGSSFAGSLPGTHAELQAVNGVLQSGAEGPINIATLRTEYGGHFAACLHCRGILDTLARSVPELRVRTGVAGP